MSAMAREICRNNSEREYGGENVAVARSGNGSVERESSKNVNIVEVF
jgi:hypothetical protein